MDELVTKKHWWQSLWARAALVFGVWTVIGLIFSLQWYFAAYRSEQPVPWGRALYVQMSWGYLWALVTPFVLWLVHRFPIEKPHWRRTLLAHFLVSTVLSFITGIIGHLLLYSKYGAALGRA